MIAITTEDGLVHCISGPSAISSYSPSANTCEALRAAYDRGSWIEWTPPPVEPGLAAEAAKPQPDWKTFRLALLKSKSFRLWSEFLPSSWREDLKAAAMMNNAEALQDIYNYCKTIASPLSASVKEWQGLANASNIPVTF